MELRVKTAEDVPGELAAPVSPRVAAAAARDRLVDRSMSISAVIVPIFGALGALWLAWTFGLSWIEVTLWAVGHSLTCFGVAIGFHRLASHKSFETTSFFNALFMILGSTGAQGPVLWWAATHRRHHATSERPGDPHSPYVGNSNQPMTPAKGLLHAHVGWLFAYQNTGWMHYVPDLLTDSRVFFINQHYLTWIALSLAIPAAIGGLAHQSWQGAVLGLFWGGFLRVFTSQHTFFSVNSICHVYGSRPFESRDQARNNWLVTIPSMGEGWHNHHHTFPKTAINQFEWWQFDASGLLIRFLGSLGWAKNIHFPSREAREQYKRELIARASGNEGLRS